MKTVYSECPKKKKHVKNAEAQSVSCFSFTFHVAERVERKRGRKKKEREKNGRTRERERMWIWKGECEEERKRGEEPRRRGRRCARLFPHVSIKNSIARLLLWFANNNAFDRVHRSLHLQPISEKWVVKFSETFYRSYQDEKADVSFSIRPFLSLRRVKRVQKEKFSYLF